MHRRNFLKLAALSGMSVFSPFASRRARAATYPGPFYVMISARGGWDPTYLCDPKPFNEDIAVTLNKRYDFDPMTNKAGNIAYAPISFNLADVGYANQTSMDYLMPNQAFFDKYFNDLLVINGINMETNNHFRGVTTMWSGRGDQGLPSAAALIAAIKGPTLPLAFVSSGGYDATEALLPVTRLTSVTSFRKLAQTNTIDPNNPDSAHYHMPESMERIRTAQNDRLLSQIQQSHLPTVSGSQNALYLARNGESLQPIIDLLPESLVSLPAEISDLQRMMQQIQFAVAAFESGLAVSVNLELGGFDTHGNHDRNQVRQLAKLLHGIDFLMELANEKGILGELVVMVGSDFGRGAGYNGPNAADGKDHLPVTSAMFMGMGGLGIAGNRVIGATSLDKKQLPQYLDPETLDFLSEEEGGSQIKAADIHVALRKFAGVNNHEYSEQFPLLATEFPTLLTGE